jgi:hypothetical protein
MIIKEFKPDHQILAECNTLANRFHQLQGLVSRPQFKYYEATHPIEVQCWVFACHAYAHIEGTDVQDIVNCLE